MITAKELKEIADKQNSKTEIELLEEGMLAAAKRGETHYSKGISIEKKELKKIAEYFRNNGFDVKYFLLYTDAYDDSRTYNLTINW